jgi:hypothetical protein
MKNKILNVLFLILVKESKVINIEQEVSFPMVHPRSKLKQFWQYIMIFLMLYVALILPYYLIFVNNIVFEWDLIDSIINYLFWFDMILCFFSAYYNDEGELVHDFENVSINYLKGWFIIDLISNLPWDSILGLIM